MAKMFRNSAVRCRLIGKEACRQLCRMLRKLLPAVFATALLATTSPVLAQAGTLDVGFATAGMYVQDFGAQDNLTKLRVQADQKIVAVGTALTPAFSGQLLVVRLNPDGSLDDTFNGTGTLMIGAFNESYGYDLFFQPDGKIVVVGARADLNFQFSMLALRLNADGSLDDSFGTGGFSEPEISAADDFAYAVAPLPNGQMLLAGTATDGAFNNQPVVVRLNADGSIDQSFGDNGVASLPVSNQDNKFWNIGLQSDGRIVASGHIDQGLTGGGQFNQDVLVARFTADGQLDAGFGTDGTVVKPISTELIESAFAMVLGPDDEVFLGGYTTLPDFSFDAFVMKLGADGSDDAAFGTGGLAIFDNAAQDVFTGLALQPDGKLLACGTSGGFFFDPRDQLVARYTVGGALDNSFDLDGFSLYSVAGNFDEANAITLQADGKIVTAGKANTGANNDITVFRYVNDINTSAPERAVSVAAVYPNPARAGSFVTLDTEERIVRVRLFDALGAEVGLHAGTWRGPWRGIRLPEQLSPGTYTMQLIGATTTIGTVRLLIQD